MDSRDEAFAKLDATKEYIFAVAEDVNRALKAGFFKPGTPPERRTWLDGWRALEQEFVAYYNAVQAAGISRIDAADVVAKCADFNNRARAYQQKLATLGAAVVTPVPPEDKPPPTLGQGLQEAGKGMVYLAGAVLIGVLLLRK